MLYAFKAQLLRFKLNKSNAKRQAIFSTFSNDYIRLRWGFMKLKRYCLDIMLEFNDNFKNTALFSFLNNKWTNKKENNQTRSSKR